MIKEPNFLEKPCPPWRRGARAPTLKLRRKRKGGGLINIRIG